MGAGANARVYQREDLANQATKAGIQIKRRDKQLITGATYITIELDIKAGSDAEV